MRNKRPFFVNYVIEVFDIDKSLLLKTKNIEPRIKILIEEIGLITIKSMSHDFRPYGATISYILSSSHMTVHTWPENNYLHIHILNCKKIELKSLNDAIKELFPNKEFKIKEIDYNE